MAVSTNATFLPVISQALNKLGNQPFAGLRILPAYNAPTRKGTYPTFEEEMFDNDAAKARAPGAKFPRIDYDYASDTYSVKQYALESTLPDEEETEARENGFDDIRGAMAMNLQRNLLVGHERRVSDLVYTASTFTETAQTGGVMSNKSAALPIETIQNAVTRLSSKGFNDRLALIIELSLYNEMLNTNDVRNIFNGNGQYVAQPVLQAALGVDQIIICNSYYNSAAKGKSATRTKIWPTDKYMIAQVAGGDFSAGGFGRTISFQPNGGIFTAETYRDETNMQDVLRVYNAVTEKIINTNAAEVITTA